MSWTPNQTKMRDVHNDEVEHEILMLHCYEQGKVFRFAVCSKDTALLVFFRGSPCDSREYLRIYYQALTLACAAYYRVATE